MATLSSVRGEMQLFFRLLGKSYDPFQMDLEWFEYEMCVEGRRQPAVAAEDASLDITVGVAPSSAARGLESPGPLRFEPRGLDFYFEWSRETPLVYLIVTWFDLALFPRGLDQRFPTAHGGFRFLTGADSLARFRRALEQEFVPSERTSERKPSTLIN